jgi:hypothetical protein
MRAKNLVVYAVDIGSVKKGRFAWASSRQTDGTDMRDLAHAVALDLKTRKAVALGFEAPLWVPLADEPLALTKGRDGEGNRAWSAGAGSGALATGLVEVAWILGEVRKRVVSASVHLDWSSFECAAGGRLFVWEAFVSGAAKGSGHVDDAQIAVRAFQKALPEPAARCLVRPRGPVISLIGASLLRAGWSSALDLLGAPCLVLGPPRIVTARVASRG